MSRWLEAARKARAGEGSGGGVLSEASVLSDGGEAEARSPDRTSELPEPTPNGGEVHPLPAGWAEGFAALRAKPAPEGLAEAAWPNVIDKGLTATACHAEALEGLGWTFRDLFRAEGSWPRLDLRGRGWLLADALCDGGTVLAMDETAIRYRNRAGATFTIWKPGREPWIKQSA